MVCCCLENICSFIFWENHSKFFWNIIDIAQQQASKTALHTHESNGPWDKMSTGLLKVDKIKQLGQNILFHSFKYSISYTIWCYLLYRIYIMSPSYISFFLSMLQQQSVFEQCDQIDVEQRNISEKTFLIEIIPDRSPSLVSMSRKSQYLLHLQISASRGQHPVTWRRIKICIKISVCMSHLFPSAVTD